MKSLMVIIMFAAMLFLTGCSELCTDATHLLSGGEHVGGAVTMLAGVDLADSVNQYDLRAGVVIDKLEVGAVVSMYHDRDIEENWGAYVLREMTDEAIGVIGKPSIGFQTMFGTEDYHFLTETIHELAPGVELRTSLATRTFGGEAEDWKVSTGPRFRF